MKKLIDWSKRNPIVLVLFALLVWQQMGRAPIVFNRSFDQAVSVSSSPMRAKSVGFAGEMAVADTMIAPLPPFEEEFAPVGGDDRLVIRDTSMSLLVKDVRDSLNSIGDLARTAGGFMVNTNLSSPEGGASGNISVQVPSEKRDEVVDSIRDLGVRVVSENVYGRDVTAEFEDLDARLAVLTKTKDKFEGILESASKVQDLLQVQRELVSLQSQIDNLKGRQKYLAESARLTKISVYVSTDELALPFAPENPWRPNVIVKRATRSLVANVRNFGSALIWLGVYSVVWIPVLGGIWAYKKRSSK